MECRCYHGGEGRTRLRQLRYAPRDWAVLAFFLAVALFGMGAWPLRPLSPPPPPFLREKGGPQCSTTSCSAACWRWICALALCLGLSGPVSAAGDVYFSVVNDSMITLSDSTMPVWSGGVLYVPHSVSLTGPTPPASASASTSAITGTPGSPLFSPPSRS